MDIEHFVINLSWSELEKDGLIDEEKFFFFLANFCEFFSSNKDIANHFFYCKDLMEKISYRLLMNISLQSNSEEIFKFLVSHRGRNLIWALNLLTRQEIVINQNTDYKKNPYLIFFQTIKHFDENINCVLVEGIILVLTMIFVIDEDLINSFDSDEAEIPQNFFSMEFKPINTFFNFKKLPIELEDLLVGKSEEEIVSIKPEKSDIFTSTCYHLLSCLQNIFHKKFKIFRILKYLQDSKYGFNLLKSMFEIWTLESKSSMGILLIHKKLIRVFSTLLSSSFFTLEGQNILIEMVNF